MTIVTVIPPTPVPSAQASPTVPTTDVAAAAPAAADDKEYYTFQLIAENRIELMAEWLRHHVDIFTHLSEGMINTCHC